jgi:hypothetical protein
MRRKNVTLLEGKKTLRGIRAKLTSVKTSARKRVSSLEVKKTGRRTRVRFTSKR